MTKSLILCILLYSLGNFIVWFQLNGQFKWDFWKENIILIGALGIPISITFFYATRYAVDAFDGTLWPGRLIAFGLSMILFTMLTWVILGEPFTTKTAISLGLAIILIAIQILL